MIWLPVGAAFGAALTLLAVWFLQNRNLPGPGVHTGPMLAVPDREPTSLLTPPDGMPVAQQAAHADAMHAISAPYVGVHQRTIPRVRSGVQPWETAPIPAVTDADAIEAMRREYIASRFREQEQAGGEITTGFMRETVALSRELPAREPVYGETCQANVQEAERLNQVMAP